MKNVLTRNTISAVLPLLLAQSQTSSPDSPSTITVERPVAPPRLGVYQDHGLLQGRGKPGSKRPASYADIQKRRRLDRQRKRDGRRQKR